VPNFGERRVMGCSRADLERWVRELLGSAAPGLRGDDRLDLRPAGVPLSIVVRDAPPRARGLIRFRELDVRFEFAPADREAALAWIGAFDRHTQRGGG
jgi:hypothetical protein